MKITHCKLNHLINPLGYTLPQLSFTWQVEESIGTNQTAACHQRADRFFFFCL